MSISDTKLLALWAEGKTLEDIAVKHGKTPTSIAHKLVRLGIFENRSAVNIENQSRGGDLTANMEHDALYTIYVVRNPNTNEPIYIGQTQNFRKRKKNHVRRFTKLLDGETPVIEELETVQSYSQARDIEKKQIAEFSDLGFSLLNIQDRELCRET